jgi:hypothetical protein
MENSNQKVGSKVLQVWQQPSISNTTPSVKPEFPGHKFHHRVMMGFAAIFTTFVIFWTVGMTGLRSFQINNRRISANISSSKLEKIIDDEAQAYKLTISDKDSKQVKYNLGDIGIEVDPRATSLNAKSISGKLRTRLRWWKPTPIEMVTIVDQAKLNSFEQEHLLTSYSPTKNATLTINSDGTITTTKEVVGTAFEVDGGKDSLIKSIKALDQAPLKMVRRDIAPAITLDSMESSKKQLEQILNSKLTVQISDQNVQPDAHDIGSWLTISPDEKTKT